MSARTSWRRTGGAGRLRHQPPIGDGKVHPIDIDGTIWEAWFRTGEVTTIYPTL